MLNCVCIVLSGVCTVLNYVCIVLSCVCTVQSEFALGECKCELLSVPVNTAQCGCGYGSACLWVHVCSALFKHCATLFNTKLHCMYYIMMLSCVCTVMICVLCALHYNTMLSCVCTVLSCVCTVLSCVCTGANPNPKPNPKPTP